MPSKLHEALHHSTWDYSAVSHPVIETDELIGEENNPSGIECYYPMKFGEVINGRYQVVSKLGHGGWCTFWLARDLQRFKWQTERFVAIKVGLTGAHGRGTIKTEESELRVLKHISSQAPDATHSGYRALRTLLDHFNVESSVGKHLCLVFDPLHISLRTLRRIFSNERLPLRLARAVARDILSALDFLHTKCHVIHCDIKDENIIFKFPEESKDETLMEQAQREFTQPSRIKRLPDRDIYFEDWRPRELTGELGTCVLTDYDLAVIVPDNRRFAHDIQPSGLEAPEVLLRLPWSYSADIFNFGVFLCELIESKPLFMQRGPKGYDSSRAQKALKRMMDYLGSPPITMLEQADRKAREWLIRDADGGDQDPEEPKGFEAYFSSVDDAEKTMLVAFVKRMLVWTGERRATAAELLQDPWLAKLCL